MAPTYAVPRLLARNGLTPAGLRLLRDPRGVRVGGAGDAAGVGVRGVLQGAARPGRARWARSTASKLNVNGSSLAAGHPFAATGGRIVAQLAKMLAEKSGSGSRARPDLHLRRRRPGRHRHPRGLTRNSTACNGSAGPVDRPGSSVLSSDPPTRRQHGATTSIPSAVLFDASTEAEIASGTTTITGVQSSARRVRE